MFIFLLTVILGSLCGHSHALNSKCEASLYNETKNLSVICQFSGVEAGVRNCQLYWRLNGRSSLLSGARLTTVQDGTSRVNVFCSVNVTVSTLGQGSHEFSAVLSSRNGVQSRSQPVQVEFSLPEVALNRDCYYPWSRVDNCLLAPLGSCTCDLVKAGYPEGRAEWFWLERLANQEWVNGSSTLFVTTPKTSTNTKTRKFECVGTSALGKQEKGAEFEVKFPYGPSTMSLRLTNGNGDNTFDLCPGGPEALKIECDVPVANVFPSPWFHFRVNDDRPVYDWYLGEELRTIHRFNYSIKPATGGPQNVSCQPTNSCSKGFVKDNITINVREPPKAPPSLVINGRSYSGQGLSSDVIRTGENVTVSCRVDGGVPRVSDVTLRCPGQTLTSRGNSAQLTVFRASRQLSGQSCSCSARHVTGCYSGRTDVALNV